MCVIGKANVISPPLCNNIVPQWCGGENNQTNDDNYVDDDDDGDDDGDDDDDDDKRFFCTMWFCDSWKLSSPIRSDQGCAHKKIWFSHLICFKYWVLKVQKQR